MALCLYRFGFSIPFLYLMIRFGLKKRLTVTREQLGKLAFLSVWIAVTPALLFESYQYISSGMATTLNFVYPILVVAGCVIFYRAKLTREKLICCVLCAAGILCFYSPDGPGNVKGIVLAFLSGVTYAVYIVYYAKSGLTQLPALTSSFYLSCFSTLYLGVFTIGSGNMVFYSSKMAWGLTVWFAFMVSVLATVLFQSGTRRVGPENASLLSTFEPLTSVVVGFACREPMTGRSLFGIACILCSVLFLTVMERKGSAAK